MKFSLHQCKESVRNREVQGILFGTTASPNRHSWYVRCGDPCGPRCADRILSQPPGRLTSGGYAQRDPSPWVAVRLLTSLRLVWELGEKGEKENLIIFPLERWEKVPIWTWTFKLRSPVLGLHLCDIYYASWTSWPEPSSSRMWLISWELPSWGWAPISRLPRGSGSNPASVGPGSGFQDDLLS